MIFSFLIIWNTELLNQFSITMNTGCHQNMLRAIMHYARFIASLVYHLEMKTNVETYARIFGTLFIDFIEI